MQCLTCEQNGISSPVIPLQLRRVTSRGSRYPSEALLQLVNHHRQMKSTQSAHRLRVVGDWLPFFSLTMKSDACLSKERIGTASYFMTFNSIEWKQRKTSMNYMAGDVSVWEVACLLVSRTFATSWTPSLWVKTHFLGCLSKLAICFAEIFCSQPQVYTSSVSFPQ